MVDDVVAVVEGQHVEGRADVVARQPVVGRRIVGIDEDVLRERGVDPDSYATVEGVAPMPDLFIDGPGSMFPDC